MKLLSAIILSLLLLSCLAQANTNTENQDPAVTDMTQEESDVYAKYKVIEQLAKIEELQEEIQSLEAFLVPLLAWYGDDYQNGRFSEPRSGINEYFGEVTALKNELNDNFWIHPQAMSIIVAKGLIRDKKNEVIRLQEETGTTQSDASTDSPDTTATPTDDAPTEDTAASEDVSSS